jgi:DNA-binding transcriptional LysR family regulator
LKDLATASLDKAGLPWRIAFTSPSLAGVWAAVNAGLGVTVRTRSSLTTGLQIIESLPRLPSIDLALFFAETSHGPAVKKLATLIEDCLEETLSK